MALKSPEFYAKMVMDECKVPSGTSQAVTYNAWFKAIAQMFKDADVTVTVPVHGNPTNPPPAGLHVLVLGAPMPVLGADDCTGTGKLT